MKTSRLLALVLFFFQSFFFSQSYTSRHFKIQDGLPDEYVYSSFQDNKGFLWLATTKGLVKFDGQEFVNKSPKLDEGDFIYSGAVDYSGQLWFGSFMGRLFTCKNGTDELTSFTGNISGSVDRIIPSMDKKQIFFISKGNGIYSLNNNKVTQLPFSRIYQFNGAVEIKPGWLLLATPEGLYTANINTQDLKKISGTDFDITQIQKTEKKYKVLLSLNGSRLAEGYLNLGLDSIVLNPIPDIWGLEQNGINTFFYDLNRRLLYVVTRDEVFHIIDQTLNTHQVLNKKNYQATANSIITDKDGNVWISSAGKGLIRLYKEDFDFIPLNQGSVYGITQVNSQTFFGTDNGILVLDSSKQMRPIKMAGNMPLTGKISALYFDGKYLWIGSETSGLLVIDPVTNSRVNTEFVKSDNITINSITGNLIKKEVYVSTNLEGAFIYRNGKLVHHFSVQNSLLHNNVYFATGAPDGNIYYATHNTAINFSKGSQVYEINMGNNGLVSDFNSFAVSPEGNIAIGTNGDGVYFLKDTSIMSMPLNDKLDSKFCNSLTYDKNGHLWIVTRYSVHKYYPQQQVLKKIEFGNDDKVIFNQNALYGNAAGELFFGASDYVLRVKTSNRALAVPECYLRGVKISDTSVALKPVYNLKSGKYTISFEFSALDLLNSEEVKFSYLLDGRDIRWSEPGTLRRAEFFNLGEGEYEFKVKAFNSDGFSSDNYTSVRFTIAPPVWKKAWFWLILIVIVSATLYLIVRYRTAALIRAKLKLEGIVEEKTHELRLEKELVEAKNLIIEEQNKDIKDSITYAKRIQEAVLPDKDLDEKIRKNLIIYYRPKDIVSGDFYWIADKGGRHFFAACDCTGHGVPGAFMSLIGTTLFNKIVFDNNESDPVRIIQAMDVEITKSLNQESTKITDGMEAALCSIDFDKRVVDYCGAKRPLFLYRKTNDGFELEEHRPDKYPIGGISELVTKTFTLKTIQANEGDMLFMFSDGLIDQFGEKGRIGSKRIREVLNQMASVEPGQQWTFLNDFVNNWKESRTQTDDILLLGIRF